MTNALANLQQRLHALGPATLKGLRRGIEKESLPILARM